MKSTKKFILFSGLLSISCYFFGCSHTSVSSDQATTLYRQAEDRDQKRSIASEEMSDDRQCTEPPV